MIKKRGLSRVECGDHLIAASISLADYRDPAMMEVQGPKAG